MLASQDDDGRLRVAARVGLVYVHANRLAELGLQSQADQVTGSSSKSIGAQKANQSKSKEWCKANVTACVEVRNLLSFWRWGVEQILPGLGV